MSLLLLLLLLLLLAVLVDRITLTSGRFCPSSVILDVLDCCGVAPLDTFTPGLSPPISVLPAPTKPDNKLDAVGRADGVALCVGVGSSGR